MKNKEKVLRYILGDIDKVESIETTMHHNLQVLSEAQAASAIEGAFFSSFEGSELWKLDRIERRKALEFVERLPYLSYEESIPLDKHTSRQTNSVILEKHKVISIQKIITNIERTIENKTIEESKKRSQAKAQYIF